MKVIIKSFNPVAHWKWNLTNSKPIDPNQEPETAPGLTEPEETDENNESLGAGTDPARNPMIDDEDDEDLCGICRVAFEGCCPDCKVPGEDCPLIWGECTHIFHMHCLLKWIAQESSKQSCPMDRRPWVTAGGHAEEAPTT
ncbi:hypothetical protein MJO29_011456 [Puccinia striiformis f. sp. tritici]|uniref:Anaphase-promoting complex subunit 11 n=3 Tax=Puccinia striiformis TaxID=27350 RepID=A0A0L0W0N8_9BASI|nr:hypothetical protein Pst134EA_033060 [Puccinia striiformis f. sp. tritici]KAI9614695.1 hypothetical protein H4Q26_009086 [Puccinia striiformis f. sp. tritici PST-130]KNF05017.1 hypothetical protein, variant [Puccinia striiformis f. sp. tritici PST-78]POW02425.1 hypothetical protein PSTT_11808 [Puccinia striiformis]KAH9448158.1 hypothetical protein Pst134EB_033073 [Puccinia striiformis f. sp. tritici]KAH9457393.1 hypothetical protein Pst134EA_033060 [Puccinia striiformis f. sp. tritici]